MLLFLLQWTTNVERYKTYNKSEMRLGPKIEHYHLKTMLYAIL